MQCPRCKNEEEKYFYLGSKGWICRRCIQFKRQLIEENLADKELEDIRDSADEYMLKYPLTPKQKSISEECLKSLIKGKDVFLDAICGAGKTELTLASISYFLKAKKRVGFAVARRQVVLDLYGRLKGIFKQAKVIAVCQGYTDDVVGDLIVCTTHQLYRYPNTFDLLVLDEPDAFPYKGNKVLEGIVKTSCRGRMIYLTATPDQLILNRIKNNELTHLKLYRIPHDCDIAEPKLFIAPLLILFFILLYWIKEHSDKSLLIFVPTIKTTKVLYRLLSCVVNIDMCTSKTENKDEIIQAFRDKKIQCLLATTILERGVTIEGIDVCIFGADHGVFDEASLIQMSGRVGRSFTYPTGDCLFLSTKKSKLVDDCIETCKEVNRLGRM
jgi:competence protein ComFA